MAVSIAHRASGTALALVGLPLLVCFLAAVAAGPDVFDRWMACARTPVGLIVLIGLNWALFQHMGSGIRHLYLDAGAGFELKANRTGSIAVFVWAVVATIVLWGLIFGGLI